MIGLAEVLIVFAIVVVIFLFKRRGDPSGQTHPRRAGGTARAGAERRRALETRLAHVTLGALVVFAPLETWATWTMSGGAGGLLSPFYLVDLIGMVLLLFGTLHSLVARPEPAPGVMCAAHAWMAANGWRATFGRVDELAQGGQLDFGAPELWVTAALTALACVCFTLSLFLTARATAVSR